MEVLIVSSKVPNQYMNPSYPEPENFNQLSPAFNPKDVFVINNSIYAYMDHIAYNMNLQMIYLHRMNLLEYLLMM